MKVAQSLEKFQLVNPSYSEAEAERRQRVPSAAERVIRDHTNLSLVCGGVDLEDLGVDGQCPASPDQVMDEKTPLANGHVVLFAEVRDQIRTGARSRPISLRID